MRTTLPFVSFLISILVFGAQAQANDAKHTENPSGASLKLQAILAAQPDEHKARHTYRHPQETLDFFGIQPGMTLVEYLPSGGWYSQFLSPYLGADGTLVGIDYSMNMWPHFSWVSEQFLSRRTAWPKEWSEKVQNWGGDSAPEAIATTVSTADKSLYGQADAALFIRALHNLARFEHKGGYLTEALNLTYALLKPGGIVGVVQHQAPETHSDEWANGSKGYLKKSFVVEVFTNAGFELVAESDINQNPNDKPTEDDMVWRLPPSLSGSTEGSETQAEYIAIGESNRMTLLFKKPEQ